MIFNEKVLTEQIYAVRDFLFHYSSYRILHQNFDALSNKGSDEFWAYTINAHYFQAINLWCMVFGTDNNEIHWKKLGLNQELRTLLVSELELSEKDYLLYWNKIIEWRNKFSAHRVPDFRTSTPTPDLKIARRIIFVYEKWLHKHVDFFLEFSLENYENDYCKKAETTINVF